MKRLYVILLLLSCLTPTFGQQKKAIESSLRLFFSNYEPESFAMEKAKLKSITLNTKTKTLQIHAHKEFAFQPFRPQTVDFIYNEIRAVLPQNCKNYKLTLFVEGKRIEDLVPNYYRTSKLDMTRLFHQLNYIGAPWVSNESRPNEISRGLLNKHIAVWQSHGKYYANRKRAWLWQRPNLFCTTEDLYTQQIVIPYLIPMLEKAGAIVFTPRERDIQNHEVVVDNDSKGYFEEHGTKIRWEEGKSAGFSTPKERMVDGENPFSQGTYRQISTQASKSYAMWVPTIPQKGSYGVYVSYKTLPNSVSDAIYYVIHQGTKTKFSVNQKMGGSTWVYLGTFDFDKGESVNDAVVLENQGKESGVLTADAVRFGGGMGNIARGVQGDELKISGLPRYLEGARYSAQYGGAPTSIYRQSDGENDYTDDLHVRSSWVNYLAGGSIMNPKQSGLNVPFEMSLGVHTDAGYRSNGDFVGTLGVYSTDYNNGNLGNGKSRDASRDLIDLLITQVQSDIQGTFHVPWARRGMWDKPYSESRFPEVPSAILELLSHQNFADMLLGHDPRFQFTAGRAIYKAIVRFIATQHDLAYEIAPLPISHFATQVVGNRQIELSWRGVEDPLEPTANPKQYIVYTRENEGSFDNGKLVNSTKYLFKEAKIGVIYSFKIAAVNRGGESFESETLCAMIGRSDLPNLLLINGFNRIAPPSSFNDSGNAGFELDLDPGVPYLYNLSFNGLQLGFDKQYAGREDSIAFGFSGRELGSKIIKGNTFDYSYLHGKAIEQSLACSFSSSSETAVEDGTVLLKNYKLIDLIYGLQKAQLGVGSKTKEEFKTFSAELKQALTTFTKQGGSVFVSGAYIGSDNRTTTSDINFTEQILKYSFGYADIDPHTTSIKGVGRTFEIPRSLNPNYLMVPSVDCLKPTEDGIPTFVYQGTNYCAGVGYKGNYNAISLGFPFESISNEKERSLIMGAVLRFLIAK